MERNRKRKKGRRGRERGASSRAATINACPGGGGKGAEKSKGAKELGGSQSMRSAHMLGHDERKERKGQSKKRNKRKRTLARENSYRAGPTTDHDHIRGR